jgi:hypothetical protein
MAEIKLYPRKEFEIILEDGTVIKGQFGTWALKRFCDKQGYILSVAAEKLRSPEIGDIVEYLLACIEYVCKKVPKDFTYNDVDCCSWIDELGGVYSDNVLKLFRHSGDENPTTEEKKTDS